MGAQAIFGFQASTYSALGTCGHGTARGSVMGSKPSNAWVVNLSGKMGKQLAGQPTAWMAFAFYKASGTTITELVSVSNGTFAVTGVMSNGSNGAVYSKPPALPVQRWANQVYALALRSDANVVNHGQDASGHRMSKRSGFSFPNPFNASTNPPEGKMALWATEILNTAPKTPSGLAPSENSQTNIALPTLGADFRDDEEVLPGYALGDGDKVKKYQFKVLTADGKTVLRDSGVLTATIVQQGARRVTWTVTGADLAGDYLFSCQMWDMFDQPSPVKTWAVTVAGGGVAQPTLHPDNQSPVSSTVAVSTTPGFSATWNHEDGKGMVAYSVRIVQQSNGAIVRPAVTTPLAVADGGSFSVVGSSLFPSPWSALARGVGYRFEVQAEDADGLLTAWVPSPWFWVNSIPAIPWNVEPDGATVTAIPTLSATLWDADLLSQFLSPRLEIRLDGGSATLIDSGFSYLGGNVWAYTPTSAQVDQNGDWDVRWSAVDVDGEQSPWSSWSTFSLVDPPAISNLYPDNDDVVEIMSPTVLANVDRTVSSYRVTIMDSEGVVVYPGPLVSSSVISHQIPVGILNNNASYSLELVVNTTDGLSTSVVTSWTVDYPNRAPLSGYAVTRRRGPFEPTDKQASEVDVRWDAIPEEPTQLFFFKLAGDLVGEDTGGTVVAETTGSFEETSTADPQKYGFGEGGFGEEPFGGGS